jgi:erythromycin esterase-like protein
MKITIDIPLNPRQTAKMNRWLAKFNRQRQRSKQHEFASVNDAIRWHVINLIRECVASADKGKARKVMQRYTDADESVQSQIEALLGGV